MEPRTASAIKRLQTVEALAKAGVPVGVMNAPIIPGLNHHEIPNILKAAADHGAQNVGMTIVRLNADENKTLINQLKIDELPTLLLYQNNQVIWKHSGYLSEEDLTKQLQ